MIMYKNLEKKYKLFSQIIENILLQRIKNKLIPIN